jgi:hypothetical protein
MAVSDLEVRLRLDTKPMEQELRAIAQGFLDAADALAAARINDDAEDE